MKNLIITLGILSLMMIGSMYDIDMLQIVRQEMRMSWICEEMRDAAVFAYEKEESLKEAERAASEILRRNVEETYDDVTWTIEKVEGSEGKIVVKLKFDIDKTLFHIVK